MFKNNPPTITVIMTDYGTVQLSSRSLNYLESIDPKWAEIHSSRRKKSKENQRITEKVEDFLTTVRVLAEMYSHNNITLKVF